MGARNEPPKSWQPKLRAEQLAAEAKSKTLAAFAAFAVATPQTLKMPCGDAEAPLAMSNPDGERLKQPTLAIIRRHCH
jgi:hypothetical protein